MPGDPRALFITPYTSNMVSAGRRGLDVIEPLASVKPEFPARCPAHAESVRAAQ